MWGTRLDKSVLMSCAVGQVYPESSLLGGRTAVTIEGSNLGYRADQVNNVTVAGVRCDVNAAEYRVSTRYVYVTVIAPLHCHSCRSACSDFCNIRDTVPERPISTITPRVVAVFNADEWFL